MKTTNISLILLAISAMQISACGVGEASPAADNEADATTPVPVAVAYPERASIFATYRATTTIGSEGDAPVLARVPGELVELLVEEGDWVEEGQVLARLDGERLRLEMLAAKANLLLIVSDAGCMVDRRRKTRSYLAFY